jgi:hypothetical protein
MFFRSPMDKVSDLGTRISVRAYEAQKGQSHMKQTAMLTTASLFTILFMTLHLTGDILFQMAPAGLVNLLAIFVFVVQLHGTLVLGGRRAGYIIIFFGSALVLVVPVIYMKGTRGLIGGDIGTSSQAFLFVRTILALGITATFSDPIGERTVEFAMAPGSPHVNCRIAPNDETWSPSDLRYSANFLRSLREVSFPRRFWAYQ